MPTLPNAIHIKEYGPREGFQIASADIPTARKIALIDALSATGLKTIEVCSFVDPRRVPQMADAEDIVGHTLPGSVMTGGSLGTLRRRLRGAA